MRWEKGHVVLVGGLWQVDKYGSEDTNKISSLPLSEDYAQKGCEIRHLFPLPGDSFVTDEEEHNLKKENKLAVQPTPTRTSMTGEDCMILCY